MANSDPAFLFYSKDWLTSDTVEMSARDRGVYINFLAYQHINGSLPIAMEKLEKIALMDKGDGKFSNAWDGIKHKFITKNNRLVNQRLVMVMDERIIHAKKNRISGIFATLIRQCKHKSLIPDIKKSFKVDDYMNIEKEELTERITKWFTTTVDRLLKMEM